MNIVFYLSAAVALAATARVITCVSAVHGLLYLIVSLLAVAMAFLAMGAPFIAALEVILYAGAIMVLFVFVMMMLNLDMQADAQNRRAMSLGHWIGPGLLGLILAGELAYIIGGGQASLAGSPIGPQRVGLSLFGAYVLGVELASVLLLAGLVGAYHLGRRAGFHEEGQTGHDDRSS